MTPLPARWKESPPWKAQARSKTKSIQIHVTWRPSETPETRGEAGAPGRSGYRTANNRRGLLLGFFLFMKAFLCALEIDLYL
ncbi:hypothetical protein NHX12_006945 [Muraenolepis orangiensis]|uniref:Uncharacterized protein n=1 Tax=Muraenolepis orangiensis TaxID=630683 RepID=A0A9Q0DQN0_9TELE|nr:hypothetical protein NHX12_006945 [Muraenolepis orangiensis]